MVGEGEEGEEVQRGGGELSPVLPRAGSGGPFEAAEPTHNGRTRAPRLVCGARDLRPGRRTLPFRAAESGHVECCGMAKTDAPSAAA